jgi:hypothetical protein
VKYSNVVDTSVKKDGSGPTPDATTCINMNGSHETPSSFKYRKSIVTLLKASYQEEDPSKIEATEFTGRRRQISKGELALQSPTSLGRVDYGNTFTEYEEATKGEAEKKSKEQKLSERNITIVECQRLPEFGLASAYSVAESFTFNASESTCKGNLERGSAEHFNTSCKLGNEKSIGTKRRNKIFAGSFM